MNPVQVAEDVFFASGTTVNWVLTSARGCRLGPRHRLTSSVISRPVDGGIHPPAR